MNYSNNARKRVIYTSFYNYNYIAQIKDSIPT